MHVLRHRWLAAAYAAAASALLTSTLVLAGCSSAVEAAHGDGHSGQTGQPAAPGGDPQALQRLHEYQADVLPILQKNCLRCHGGMNRRGGLNMSTRAALLQGGKDGAVVVLGHAADSLLLHVIDPRLPESDPMRMPPKGDRLSDAEVATIRKWVMDGVVMDR